MNKKQFSRRSFVKSTALTGGVLLSPSFSLEAMGLRKIEKFFSIKFNKKLAKISSKKNKTKNQQNKFKTCRK